MISYVKIYGPPLMKAIKALEKVAVDMPEVCIMDMNILAAVGAPVAGPGGPFFESSQEIVDFFGYDEIPKERCDTIISKSGETLGEYDFYFEWFTEPNMTQVGDLIERIDAALMPIGVRYTLTTK